MSGARLISALLIRKAFRADARDAATPEQPQSACGEPDRGTLRQNPALFDFRNIPTSRSFRGREDGDGCSCPAE